MGDSFFGQLCNESLSIDERAEYGADAAYMYQLSGMDDTAVGEPFPPVPLLAEPLSGPCGDLRLARLIAFVEQCRKAARAA